MKVQAHKPETLDDVARQGAKVLREGGLVVFPTETAYGVAASTAHPDAVKRLMQFKEARPYTIHLPAPEAAARYVSLESAALRRLVMNVFPGPVTLAIETPPDLLFKTLDESGIASDLRDCLYAQGVLVLRCADQDVTRQMLAQVPEPVIACSAHASGHQPCFDAACAEQSLGERAQLVIDGGRTRYAKPSTLLRVRTKGNGVEVTVQRAGVYDERIIRKLMRWTLVLVCSGNTCRSPMAEGLARKMLAERLGIPADELGLTGVRVLSAGTFAGNGMPAAREAVSVMKKAGIDLTGHRSRQLTPDLLHEADVVYCMSASHLQAVLEMDPSAASKTMLLDPSGDISDPIGGSETLYQHTADHIRQQLQQRLKEQQI